MTPDASGAFATTWDTTGAAPGSYTSRSCWAMRHSCISADFTFVAAFGSHRRPAPDGEGGPAEAAAARPAGAEAKCPCPEEEGGSRSAHATPSPSGELPFTGVPRVCGRSRARAHGWRPRPRADGGSPSPCDERPPPSRSLPRCWPSLSLLAAAVSRPAGSRPGGGRRRRSPTRISTPGCGIDIHVILDESGSIANAGATDDVRRAFRAFTSALANTGSRMAVSEFSTVARLPLPGAGKPQLHRGHQPRPSTPSSTRTSQTTSTPPGARTGRTPSGSAATSCRGPARTRPISSSSSPTATRTRSSAKTASPTTPATRTSPRTSTSSGPAIASATRRPRPAKTLPRTGPCPTRTPSRRWLAHPDGGGGCRAHQCERRSRRIIAVSGPDVFSGMGDLRHHHRRRVPGAQLRRPRGRHAGRRLLAVRALGERQASSSTPTLTRPSTTCSPARVGR